MISYQFFKTKIDLLILPLYLRLVLVFIPHSTGELLQREYGVVVVKAEAFKKLSCTKGQLLRVNY